MTITLRPHQIAAADAVENAYRRRHDDRPTAIYWLVDMRTNTPFYCGKTVLTLIRRLYAHKQEAARGNRKVHVKVRECGDYVAIRLMELVPASGDWGEREKRWIWLLRHHFTSSCNTVDGGAGVPGRIASADTRRKIIEANTGRKHLVETRFKISQFLTGRKWSVESIAKMRATKKGCSFTDEHRANISKAKKGKPGKPQTAERRAKISAANKGKKRSPETIARMRAAPNSGRFVKR